jgi:MFS family permease
MFLPLFGGIILDKIGISLGLVAFCFILSLG